MRYLFFFLLLFSAVEANTVYLVPYEPLYLNQALYEPSSERPAPRGFEQWQCLATELNKVGYDLKATDLSECIKKEKVLKKNEFILFYDMPSWIHPNWQDELAKLPREQLILIAYEPPCVRPALYSENTLSLFGSVLTWDDALVDNVKFFKYCYPDLLPMQKTTPSFSKRKLLTQISGNKSSTHPHQLYSERLKIIQYFENLPKSDFRFYGMNWRGLHFKNYRGAPKDKIATLKKYRFTVCYENMRHIKGYITEKIFDCFAAGSVPIYWGASNISKYIPRGCFIDRRHFKNEESLYLYLKKMPKIKYQKYQCNIRQFLSSKKAKKFTPEAFSKVVIKLLEKKGLYAPRIHVFGDSHAKFSFGTIKETNVHYLGPRTMHRTGRDGLQGLNVKEYGVRENDTVIFVFGEIDARCHILPQIEKGRDAEEIIATLVHNYLTTICLNMKQFQNSRTAVFAIVPPSDQIYNEEYPFRGTLQERIQITKKINRLLHEEAKKLGIGVIDVHDDYATFEGALNPALSDGHVHIHPSHTQAVESALTKFLTDG